MGFIKDFLSKLSCHHEWYVHDQTKTYEREWSKKPYKIEQTLICKKCGKIKKIGI